MLLDAILQKMKLEQRPSTRVDENGPRVHDEWLKKENQSLSSQHQDYKVQEQPTRRSMETGDIPCTPQESVCYGIKLNDAERYAAEHRDDQTAHCKIIILDQGVNMDKVNDSNGTSTALTEKDAYDGSYELSLRYRNRMSIIENHQVANIHRTNTVTEIKQERFQQLMQSKFPDKMKKTSSDLGSSAVNTSDTQTTNKRVIIHMLSRKSRSSREQIGKLINLPGSLEELFKTASKYYLTKLKYVMKP